MAQKNIRCAIVFADIAGSTKLYEEVGDDAARRMCSYVVGLMSNITRQHRGRVIKTIGDEVMSAYPDPAGAIKATMEMQETISNDYSQGRSFALRIGAHFGPAILEGDGDIFGDAVNVAARMVGIAKAGQIITTEDVISRLPPEMQQDAREFDRTKVKGKAEEMVVYEVLWQQEDVTRMASPGLSIPAAAPKKSGLLLRWRDKEKALTENTGTVVIGRGDQADFMVDDRLASRMHARIEFRRGKFVLIDQSTNGTFVQTNDGNEVYLRREELALWGGGKISLGRSIKEPDAEIIHYLGE